jgi:hypothetical protein
MPINVKLPYKWPLAIDIVKKGFRAHWDKRLLQLFQELYHGLGPNIEQTLLGSTGFVTIDPENIETMLSTRFGGTSIAGGRGVGVINIAS